MNYKYSALDVANYIVWYVDTNKLGTVTPLKLQKILYYVYTTYLKKNDKPLFDDCFEKWQYGPVVTDVYHTFKMHGFNHISTPKPRLENDPSKFLGIRKIDFDPNLFLNNNDFIEDANNVINNLVKKGAFDLVEMTHVEPAWKDFEKEIISGKKELKYSIDELKSAQSVI